MAPQQAERTLIFGMLEYLTAISETVGEANKENVDIAVQCLSSAFDLDTTNNQHVVEHSYKLTATLPELFKAGVLVCLLYAFIYVLRQR